MIATTIGAAVGAFDVLQRIGAERRLPREQQAAYHVAKLLRLLKPEVEHYHAMRRAKILEWGAERPTTDAERAATGQATTIEVMAQHHAEFQAFVVEVQAVAVMIDWAPLRLDELTVAVSSLDLYLLEEAGLLEGLPRQSG